MDWSRILTAVGWFTMVWFAATGLALLILQAILPQAWGRVRAAPPRGPEWAHSFWYRRERIYGLTVVLCMVVGAVIAGLYWMGLL